MPLHSRPTRARQPRDWTEVRKNGERVIVEPLTSEDRHYHFWKLPELNVEADAQLARCSCGHEVAVKNFEKVATWEEYADGGYAVA